MWHNIIYIMLYLQMHCLWQIICVYRYTHILVFIYKPCICKGINVLFSLNREPPGNIKLQIFANIHYLNNIPHLAYSKCHMLLPFKNLLLFQKNVKWNCIVKVIKMNCEHLYIHYSAFLVSLCLCRLAILFSCFVKGNSSSFVKKAHPWKMQKLKSEPDGDFPLESFSNVRSLKWARFPTLWRRT